MCKKSNVLSKSLADLIMSWEYYYELLILFFLNNSFLALPIEMAHHNDSLVAINILIPRFCLQVTFSTKRN